MAEIDPHAIVHPGAEIGEGTSIGPYATIGPDVRIGRNCRIGASAVIDGKTELGDGTHVFPFASIGMMPQDLKYRGEPTRLKIGKNNVFREFVTIHRGTEMGGGLTSIGDHNLFMAYAHVAHDCRIGNYTIFGNAATLGGHVWVENFATISAFSGVHQFCRVGEHAFIGGYSVVTKDALPYAKTVGNRARIYGLNTIGLIRRGFSEDTLSKLKRAYRYLLVSRLNTSRALREIEQDDSLACDEVAAARGLHPQLAPRCHPAASDTPRRGNGGRRIVADCRLPIADCELVQARFQRNRQSATVNPQPSTRNLNDEARSHCRQRPVPVPGARRREGAGARRHGHRGQGRSVSRARSRGRARAEGAPCTGSRSGTSAPASSCSRRRASSTR